MNSFRLKIVTPDGLVYDGQAEELIVRTTSGDLGILAGHINVVAPLGMGQAVVVVDGQRKTAACIGGMVTVVNGVTTLVPTTFEWAEDIDFKRAAASEQRAKAVIANKDTSKTDLRLAEARLKRALVRKNVASRK
jgi:F-type H+-transporting ATPase subunit epsilon